jgi:hypothetical protein
MSNSSPNEAGRQARLELAALRTQIAAAPDLDRERRERALREVDALADLLKSPEPGAGFTAESSDRLQNLALEFEASHPQAAELIGRLTNLLASMGI